jgi:hypothetical protein
MSDLTEKQAELTAEAWQGIERLERRIRSLRNALQHAGPGTPASAVANVVAEEALALAQTVSKAEGFAAAVSRM